MWQDAEALKAANEELQSLPLQFVAHDVRYLIVSTDDEIPYLLDALHSADGPDDAKS